MKNFPERKTYQNITLWHYDNGPAEDFAKLYIHVVDSKLKLHADVTYRSGKELMAHMMLVTGKMPEVRHHDEGLYSFTVYDLYGFID